jgi:hypothetical protein
MVDRIALGQDFLQGKLHFSSVSIILSVHHTHVLFIHHDATAGEFSNFQNAGRNVYKEVAIMWKNKESYVD